MPFNIHSRLMSQCYCVKLMYNVFITSMDMFASDIVNNFYYFTVTKKTQGLFALLSKI